MKNIIVHIIVIGFHHKRGCEIEFVYPPIIDLDSDATCNTHWKNLPNLAMPDGVHKTNSDIFNFIFPNGDKTNCQILFGTSCFKQISSDNIKNKSEEITRNSIQKSVVILSTQPLFNAISSLLHGITENYFDVSDFNDRNVIIESYHQLNEHFNLTLQETLNKSDNDLTNLIDQGFSLSDLILRYEHNIITLIKFIILRKKLLFFMEPISKLTSTILCLISLFKGEFTGSRFQETMKYVNDNVEETSSEYTNTFEVEEASLIPNDVSVNLNDSESSLNNENKLSAGTSLFQNIKSGGGQAIKAFSNFAAVSSLLRSPESDMNTKQSQIDDLSAPLPPFTDKVGYVRDNDKLNCPDVRDTWGFPLGIFDERNILLPYASLGNLNVLDNKKINSFVIGASNHLWKMKTAKIDVIINEDNKVGGIECFTKDSPNNNKKTDETLTKLAQLTVLDRRLAEYLLRVVRNHTIPMTKSSSSVNLQAVYSKNSDSNSDFSVIDIGEDVLTIKQVDAVPEHKFPDQKSLDDWLRQVLIDYIRALLLSAAGFGTRQSFLEFGWDFMLAVQQQDYFKDWYYSIDKTKVIQESNYSNNSLLASESSLSLPRDESSMGVISFFKDQIKNLSTNKDSSEADLNKKVHLIMTYDHPGRFVPGKLGDNIPGYYQMKEYADQSKALVNRSVNEIKRIGTERGFQIKSSVSAGFSKLSGMAKVHGSKFNPWWQNDSKTEEKISDENNTIEK